MSVDDSEVGCCPYCGGEMIQRDDLGTWECEDCGYVEDA